MADKGDFIHIEDSFKISYYDRIILFQIPEIFEVAQSVVNNDTIEDEVLSSAIRYKYYAYRSNNPIGYIYDSLNENSRRWFTVDSFLTAKAFSKFKFYDRENDSLIETLVDYKTQIITEKYIPLMKYDETYPDSSYRYFSNDDELKNVEFSFSRFLDSVRNRKLIKVKFTHNPIPRGKYPFDVPRRDMVFEIRKTLETNPEVVNFLERLNRP